MEKKKWSEGEVGGGRQREREKKDGKKESEAKRMGKREG